MKKVIVKQLCSVLQSYLDNVLQPELQKEFSEDLTRILNLGTMLISCLKKHYKLED